MSSGISWTDEMWSVVTGCTQVSEECDACYAMTLSATKLARLPQYSGVAVRGDDGPEWTGVVRTHPDRLDMPLRWRRPRRVFVAGMADLFHGAVPDEFIGGVWDAMARAPQHSYQVLTKRPGRMRGLLSSAVDLRSGPLPNVWCGTTIGLGKYAWRADHLLATPAAVRWLSVEPLLGPMPSLDFDGIDWVVVGGESGARRRPMELAWLVDVVERAKVAGTAVFVKQDSHTRPGQQGRIPDDVWALKEFPR